MTDQGDVRGPVRRLLLVEDDPGDAFLVGELLAEVDPDLTLTVAGSLPAALAQLDGTDCVLLELNLPGFTGPNAAPDADAAVPSAVTDSCAIPASSRTLVRNKRRKPISRSLPVR